MPGTRRWPASFADRLDQPLPGLRQVARMFATGGFRRPAGDDINQIPVARSGLPQITAGQTSVTWVGHASFVVRIGGLTVLTDPVWSRRIPGVAPRLTPVGVEWDELPKIDAVVISHNHYDHLDAPTIARLPRETPILVPAKLARWFTRKGFSDVTELDWWEGHSIGPVRFDFVPAHHWSRRTFFDFCRTLWGGWVLTAQSGARVYFAGDTAYGQWFTEIGSRFPGVDIALMPVGAYEPRWFMRPSHVDPTEAVRACLEVGARHMVPMHWGTFTLSAEPVMAPLELAQLQWQEAGREPDDLWPLAVGESRILQPAKTEADVRDTTAGI